MIPKDNVAYLQSALDADVQTAYKEFFHNCSTPNAFDCMLRLKELTGVRPKVGKRAIQKKYDELVPKGMIMHALKVKELTGIAPHVDERWVQLFYKNCTDDDDNMKYAVMLKELTGIRPSKAFLKKYPKLEALE